MSDIKDDASIKTGSAPDMGALTSVLSSLKSGDDSAAPDILSGLLSNPEMLSKLPSMIETVKPLLQNLSSGQNDISASAPKKDESGHDRRCALLLALKPYLSPHRCDAVDYIIKISGITKLLH